MFDSIDADDDGAVVGLLAASEVDCCYSNVPNINGGIVTDLSAGPQRRDDRHRSILQLVQQVRGSPRMRRPSKNPCRQKCTQLRPDLDLIGELA